MTGGTVVVIGPTGRNFAAGMSGGSAFVFDEDGDFRQRCNLEMVDLEPLQDPDDLELVRDLLIQHAGYTGSDVAKRILGDWDWAVGKFTRSCRWTTAASSASRSSPPRPRPPRSRRPCMVEEERINHR